MSSSKYADVEADIGHPVLENGRESPVSPDNVSIGKRNKKGLRSRYWPHFASYADDSEIYLLICFYDRCLYLTLV